MQGKILSKAPCNEDLFEGGAHKKLAKVIADEIQNDSNCTIIGIDGGWGAGKSNLVGMVENVLADTPQTVFPSRYHFFNYDAWGHQNDLPRRAILEELTSEITSGENPILESHDWKIRLENLLAKKKRTSTKIVPRLNFALITIALMTALTPVIAAISDKIPTPEGRILFTGLLYAAFILFVIIKQLYNMHKNGQPINVENFFTELFLLYKDKIKEDVKFETISEREPSTKQFKDWMYDINKDLHDRGKILIVVIDNMDRLPKQKVQELWAALHSFFSEEKYSNIRVIVPFDRAHIRNASQSENITDKLKNEDVAVYGDDFINKTFYIVYSVPPPILTGWMHYFCDRWKDAFGEDSKVDNGVLQIYDMLTKEHSPRKIIAFINQFVTIRNLCDESIEDKYIALYIFGRKSIVEEPLKEILTPSYLGSLDFLYKEDERMKVCISSLYYQLPVKNAMDVIFTREVTLELDDAKTELLDKLKNTTKYWEILNHSITSVTNIENATLALNKHFGDENTIQSNHVWEALYRKSNQSVVAQDKYYQEYHNILMHNISNKEEYYAHLITVYLSNIGEGFNLTNYLDGVDTLHKTIGEMENDFLLTQKKEVSPDIFMQLLLEREDVYSEYGLVVNKDAFDDYLVSLDQNDLASKSFYGFVKKAYDLPKYKSKIKELFKKNVNNLSIEANLLKRIKEIEDSPFDVSNYINDTQIFNFCNSLTVKDEMYSDAIAMLIARYEYDGNLQNYYKNHAKGFEESFSKKVAGCIQYYINYGDLLLKAKNFNTPTFVSQVAKELTIGFYGTSRMNIKKSLFNFDTIHNSTGIAPDLLLNKWNQWDSKSLNVDDVQNLPLSLFEQCTQIDNDLTNCCLSLAQKHLASIDQTSWSSSLHKEDFNLKLLKIHHPEQLPFFIDAFKESLRNYATGDSSEKILSATVENAIDILNEQNYDLKVIFREIRDVFINNSNINKEKLKYFGKWLFEYGRLQDKQDSLNKILRSEFLDDNIIVNLIMQYPDQVVAIVMKSEDNSDFVNKLIALRNTKYKDNAEIERICDSIKPESEK
ncbi:MAG: hypothetical protein IJ816_00675 [Alloprevotella sp.]|nr:hypothetical protein [Alloprevotella sp.]